MRPSQDDRGPTTPFERGFYILVLTIVLALFGAEIYRDFHPAKLSVLFFILFWPPMVIVHEIGHALMADLLGWEVRRIVIGVNREVWRFRVKGVPVVINLLPLGGSVSPAPRNLSSPRLKLALIYLAGPGIELVVLGFLVGFLGLDLFTTATEDIGVIALQSLAVVILYGAVTNLIPFPIIDNGRTTYSDGLGFLRSFRMRRDEFTALMEAAPEVEEKPEWWDRGDEGWASDRDPDRWR